MIKKTVLMLAFLMASRATAAEKYNFITAGKISATYVDVSSISSGEVASLASIATFYFDPYMLGNRLTDFSISDTEVRCAAGEFRFTAASGYNANGERISHMTAPTPWLNIQAAPNFATLVQIVCDQNIRSHAEILDLSPIDALRYVRNSRRAGKF